jgi:hypothetical protein
VLSWLLVWAHAPEQAAHTHMQPSSCRMFIMTLWLKLQYTIWYSFVSSLRKKQKRLKILHQQTAGAVFLNR